MAGSIKMAGLFAGIGGIELGFQRALGDSVQTELLCEWWPPAREVLAARFPDVEIHPDVRELKDLPDGLDVLAAGFPCTDLSQAGRTAGIMERSRVWCRTCSTPCRSRRAGVGGFAGC